MPPPAVLLLPRPPLLPLAKAGGSAGVARLPAAAALARTKCCARRICKCVFCNRLSRLVLLLCLGVLLTYLLPIATVLPAVFNGLRRRNAVRRIDCSRLPPVGSSAAVLAAAATLPPGAVFGSGTAAPAAAAAGDAPPPPAPAEKVPRLIHRIFFNAGKEAMHSEWSASQASAKLHNPSYEIRLWTSVEIEALLTTHYAWFLPTYRAYPHPIQRFDAVRFFVLYHCGGIYMDMDLETWGPLDALLHYDLILVLSEPVGFTNFFITARKHHPFMRVCMEALAGYALNYVSPHLTLFATTGSFLCVAADSLSLRGGAVFEGAGGGERGGAFRWGVRSPSRLFSYASPRHSITHEFVVCLLEKVLEREPGSDCSRVRLCLFVHPSPRSIWMAYHSAPPSAVQDVWVTKHLTYSNCRMVFHHTTHTWLFWDASFLKFLDNTVTATKHQQLNF